MLSKYSIRIYDKKNKTMPVEIRELNIKINLSDEGGNASSSGSDDTNDTQQAIVEAVIEKVLEILKEKQER
jgi:Family of unknown function (DUF5908)